MGPTSSDFINWAAFNTGSEGRQHSGFVVMISLHIIGFNSSWKSVRNVVGFNLACHFRVHKTLTSVRFASARLAFARVLAFRMGWGATRMPRESEPRAVATGPEEARD